MAMEFGQAMTWTIVGAVIGMGFAAVVQSSEHCAFLAIERPRSTDEKSMARVIPHFMAAEVDGDFVVFLIGMRINKPWQIHKWLPVFLAVRRVLRELEAHPESWHETHQVRAGEYEAVYSGMPLYGLGKAGRLVPASGRRASARGRFAADHEPAPTSVRLREQAPA
jgi:hypothetical protein